MIRIEPDFKIQGRLENTVSKIFLGLKNIRQASTVLSENVGDLKIEADMIGKRIVERDYASKSATGRKISVLTEETSEGCSSYDGEALAVSDPLDGSSELVRRGRYGSPASTSLMWIEEGIIRGAAVGHIWMKAIYGIDDQGIYFREDGNLKGDKIHLPRGPNEQAEDIVLAAYARKSKRAQILRRIGELMEEEEIKYFDNDGGGMYPLLVASQMEEGLTAAAELKPKGLWEHIPVFMAMHAGHPASRLDGGELRLDPTVEQTSVVAANQGLVDRLVRGLESVYGTKPQSIPHAIPSNM